MAVTTTERKNSRDEDTICAISRTCGDNASPKSKHAIRANDGAYRVSDAGVGVTRCCLQADFD